MPPILQDVEASFPLDRQVRSSFPSSQRLLVQTTIVESVRQGGGFILALGRLSNSGKLNTHQRRTPGSKASLLHKPSFPGAQARYPRIEKLVFALIVASRKLRPYFQAHTILVMTDQPLRKAMGRPNAAGRMVQ